MVRRLCRQYRQLLTGRCLSVLVGIGRYWSVLVGIGRYWSVSVGRVGICRQRGLTPPYMVGPSCQRNVLHLVPEPFPLLMSCFKSDFSVIYFFTEKQLGPRYYCDFKTVSTANRVVVLRIVQKPVRKAAKRLGGPIKNVQNCTWST